jgi:hypothetical protein
VCSGRCAADSDPTSHAAAVTFPDYPGRLIESAVGKAIHVEARHRELGGEGFDGYFPAYHSEAPEEKRGA